MLPYKVLKCSNLRVAWVSSHAFRPSLASYYKMVFNEIYTSSSWGLIIIFYAKKVLKLVQVLFVYKLAVFRVDFVSAVDDNSI